MNAISFGTKRAFHGFLRVTRKPLASLGLTAARFDLMFVLRQNLRPSPRPVAQRTLRDYLGVSAPVVSRMLRSLEELGLVTRSRRAWDRRQRWVSLTELGKARIHTAARWMLRGVQRIVLHAICFGRHDDPETRFWAMDSLETYLRALRDDCGDTARLYYPWGHPDD